MHFLPHPNEYLCEQVLFWDIKNIQSLLFIKIMLRKIYIIWVDTPQNKAMKKRTSDKTNIGS